jgi:oligopeptide transport system permease protein
MNWLQRLTLRAVGTALTLLVLIAVCLMLLRAVPGGPLDGEREMPSAVRAALEAQYGLDQPYTQQLMNYIGNAAHGRLGPSMQYPDYDVEELIAISAPITMALGLLATLLALGAAIPIALNAARTGTLIMLAVPKFVLAPVLVLVFSLSLDWLPTGGFSWFDPLTWVLPVFCLALPQFFVLLRVLIENMRAAMEKAPVIAARARGYSPMRVVTRHALPLALAQTFGFMGPILVALLTGSAVVEQVFAIPGLGRYLVQAALNRDFTLLIGCVVSVATITIAAHFVVETLQELFDPRLRAKPAL